MFQTHDLSPSELHALRRILRAGGKIHSRHLKPHVTFWLMEAELVEPLHHDQLGVIALTKAGEEVASTMYAPA